MKAKRFLLLLLLVCLLVQPLYSASIKPAYGTASNLLKEWNEKIKTLKIDLEQYKQKLIISQSELDRLQTRLGILQTELAELQTELETSSTDLQKALDSLESLSNSLDDLKKSLVAIQLKSLKDKIWIGVGSGVVGILVGAGTVLAIMLGRG